MAALVLFVAMLVNGPLVQAQPTTWDWAVGNATGTNEYVRDIATDTVNGGVYTVGAYDQTSSFTPAPVQGLQDGFLTKTDANGAVLWSRRIGGNGDDGCQGVAVGPNGFVYVTGYYSGASPSFGLATTALTNAGLKDLFLACFNASGTLQWVQTGGGVLSDRGEGVAVNGSGVFVQGTYSGNASFGGTLTTNLASNQDHAVLLCYAHGGSLQWQVNGYNNGAANDDDSGPIACDDAGVYVTGMFGNTLMHWFNVTQGMVQPSISGIGTNNIYVAAFSNTGSMIWGQAVGNSAPYLTQGQTIAVGCGAVYIAGNASNGSTFPGGTTLTVPGSPGDNLYLAALNKSTGMTRWLRSATGVDIAMAIAHDLTLDREGNVLMCGQFQRDTQFSDGTLIGAGLPGGNKADMLIARYTPYGQLDWVFTATGAEDDIPWAIAADNANNTFVGGQYKADLTLPGASIPTSPNISYFVGKFTAPPSSLWSRNPTSWFPPTPICASSPATDLTTTVPTFSREYIDAVVSSSGVTTPNSIIGAPNGSVASFTTNGATLTADLSVTADPGHSFTVIWGKQSATAGMATFLLETSPDNATWTPVGAPVITAASNTLQNGQVLVTMPTRYVRITKQDAISPIPFQVDAIRLLYGSIQGGSWSGTGVTPGGLFDPSGLAGQSVAITYTVSNGSCATYATTRNIDVLAPPSATISYAGSPFCANSGIAAATITGTTGGAFSSTIGLSLNSATGAVDPANSLPGNYVVTYTIGPSGGCAGFSASAPIVIDNVPPTITCPNLVAVLNVGTNCNIPLPDYTAAAIVVDNCTGWVVTQVPAPGTMVSSGSQTITLTATNNGLSSSCSFVVPVVDNTAPIIVGCPASPIIVNVVAGMCSAPISWPTPTLANVCPGSTIIQTGGPPSGSSFAVGQHIITYAASDVSGNVSTCSFIAEAKDNIAPVLTCLPDVAMEAATGLCGAVFTYTTPTATDNCGSVSVVRISGLASGSIFPVGTTEVRHRATDNALPANTTDCVFWVTVFDASAPVLSNFANITVNSNPAACSGVVNYATPNAAETCTACATGTVPAGYTAMGTYQGRTYYYRTTTSTWRTANNSAISAGGHLAVVRDAAHNAWLRSAVDAVGGTGQIFWIGLNDVATEGTWRWTNNNPYTYSNWDTGEPNSLGGNEDYGQMKGNGKWNDEKNTTFFRSVIEVEATCITPILTSGLPSNSNFPVGTTPVTYQSTDPAGNTSTCTFNVVVNDVTPPTFGMTIGLIGFVSDNGCTITAPNYPAPSDNCSGVTVEYVSGPNPGDALPPGSYQMSYRALDAAGLYSAVQNMNVIVQDTIAPSILCPGDQSIPAAANLCGASMIDLRGLLVTSDNCAIASVSQSPSSGVSVAGTFTTIFTVLDVNGNSSSCSIQVTVNDAQAPSIGCPVNIATNANSGCFATGVLLGSPVTSDNCGVAGVTNDAPASFPIGATTVTWTVTDNEGLTATCQQTVTVVDGTAPTITCPSTVTVIAAPGACSAIANYSATALDNCAASPTISYGTLSGSSFPIGITTVNASASDGVNPAATCTFQVSVIPAMVDVAYGVTNICNTASSLLPTIATPPGGVFSDATQAGTIDPVTGAFNPALASPGPHTLGYVFNAGGCPSHDWFTITVSAPPNAGTNGTMTVCSNGFTQSLMAYLGGFPANGGTWTGPSPVVGNTYDPATMLPGVYTYLVSAVAPSTCAASSATVTVTETPAQTWYADTDVDGFGDPLTSTLACIQPAGYTANSTDLCPLDPLKQAPGNCGCGNAETSCLDCAGQANGTANVDLCGVCTGGTTGITPNTTCLDCYGVLNGTAAIDACGICSGGTTGISPNSNCLDCAGVANGTAVIDLCGVCSGGTTGITPNSTCLDCAGITNGTASIDACGVCSGGTTGISPNSTCLDCAGVANGTATIDACGVCSGGSTGITPNSTCLDCAGVANGTATIDACGVCSGGSTGITPNSTCIDCAGVANGTATIDACGVCSGGTTGIAPNSTCLDCAGVANGTASIDACGVCSGGTTGITPNSTCLDCNGTVNGTATVDACGVCSGGTTGITPNSTCLDCAGVANGTASIDACGVCSGGTTGITPNSTCLDCAGVANGTASIDACGVCSGGTTGIAPNSTCLDCGGVANGTASIDACGVCSGGTTGIAPNSTCLDCAGVANGTASIDACGVCSGGTTGITPNSTCLDCAGVANGTDLPGTACDDGNLNTTGDTWTSGCQCVGTIPCAPPSIQSITDNAPICSGSPLLLDVNASGTAPLQYAWSGSGTYAPNNASASVTVSSASTGNYTVTVSNGCGSVQATATVTVGVAPIADAGRDTTVCSLTDSLHAHLLTALGTWSGNGMFAPSANLPNVQVSVNLAGTYPFIWTVGDGQCRASDTVLITFIEPGALIAVDAGEDQYLDLATSTTLEGVVDAGVSSQWSVIQGSAWFANAADPASNITGLSIGANVLVLSAGNGPCTTRNDTVLIHVNDLFIPEGYSPNGDGVNDRFEITGIAMFPGAELNVFNRWGQNVLSRSTYANDWEGRSDNGGTLPDDTYFYVLNLSPERTYNGHIIIKR